MKHLLILPLFVAVFMLGHVSIAAAHCGCEAKKEQAEKPCAKKSKCTKCAEKMKKEKPCKPCEESERKFQMKKKRSEIFFND